MKGTLRQGLWLADGMLLMAALIWGSSYAVAKQALLFYPVLGFLAIRFGLTFVLLLPQLRGVGRRALRPGLPLGLVMLAIFLCETWGVMLTSASNAAFLISLCVVITPFMEWLLLRQRPHNTLFLACAMSLAGVWLLTGGPQLSLNLGDALMLAAALLRAVLVCLTRRLTAGREIPALALTAVQSGVVAGRAARAAGGAGVLVRHPVSGAVRHAVRHVRAEPRAGAQQCNAGVAADGLRTAVRRDHRRSLAG